jgi:hypothetical protein
MTMKSILLIVALVAALPAAANEVSAFNGLDVVTITEKPCTNEAVLARLSSRLRPLVRAAAAVVDGQKYEACWMVDGDSAHLLYEDGDQGLIPLADFKNLPGA